MFITFEGLDFCGKSTQVKLLTDFLISQNREVTLIREPGGTTISEKIRDILLDKKNSGMFEESELLLFAASRAQLVREVIIPKLENKEFVISDRFHDSTFAYQGFGRGISTDFITELMKFVVANALPDITFFIDIPFDEIAARKAKQKNLELDRIELSHNGFYEKVREGYLYLVENEERVKLIDGTKSIEEIHSEIKTVLIEKAKEQMENLNVGQI